MMFQAFSSLLLLSLFSVGHGNFTDLINVSNGGGWGEWGPLEMCPVGSRARGFSLKLVKTHRIGENTTLSAIRLYCVIEINNLNATLIQSTEGRWGSWTSPIWCRYGNLIAFSLRAEQIPGHSGKNDNAKAIIRFKCSDRLIFLFSLLSMESKEEWSPSCRYGICGIRTKVGTPQGLGDDTVLSDVQFTCCAN
ncbi:vitelline membrane outer layer protein 1 homolog [Ascaphus truei]|uniref:vitelline membrane outer layer protein 1 homolog n=1 Tax=Ascaphus truei TaxID=8439 RepID=UPI003F5ABF3D